MRLSLDYGDLTYTPKYCEENIYLLCKYIKDQHIDDFDKCTVVFISNNEEKIPMWCQKACPAEYPFVVWDYHVILLVKDDGTARNSTYVYDFDTSLPFPCPLDLYVEESFKPSVPLYESFRRRFRLVPASSFLNHFASDRSHMKTEQGDYLSPPPDYPAIVAPNGETMSLPYYRNMTLSEGDDDGADNKDGKYGEVLLEESFFDLE